MSAVCFHSPHIFVLFSLEHLVYCLAR